jgi:hypothetical protein
VSQPLSRKTELSGPIGVFETKQDLVFAAMAVAALKAAASPGSEWPE